MYKRAPPLPPISMEELIKYHMIDIIELLLEKGSIYPMIISKELEIEYNVISYSINKMESRKIIYKKPDIDKESGKLIQTIHLWGDPKKLEKALRKYIKVRDKLTKALKTLKEGRSGNIEDKKYIIDLTVEDIVNNKILRILRTVYQQKITFTNDLSKSYGISYSSISYIIEKLINTGIIRKIPEKNKKTGRLVQKLQLTVDYTHMKDFFKEIDSAYEYVKEGNEILKNARYL